MDYLETVQAAFFDELEKIAVSAKMVAHSQSRAGRRPMRAETLLRKEKEGTFYKKLAESGGITIPYAATDWQQVGMKSTKKPSESVEQSLRREDGRDNTLTINSSARQAMAPQVSYPTDMDAGR